LFFVNRATRKLNKKDENEEIFNRAFQGSLIWIVFI